MSLTNTQPDGTGNPVWQIASSSGKTVISEDSAVAEAWLAAVESSSGENAADFVIPNSEKWQILSLLVSYQTVTTAGNRRLEVQILDGVGTIVFRNRTGINQAVGLTWTYSFAPGFTEAQTTALETGYIQTLLTPMELIEDWTLRVVDKNNIDNTNDIMSVYALVRKQNMTF